jgi:hypothetical protein
MKSRALFVPIAVAGLCFAAAAAGAAEQTWRVRDGVVSVSLFRQIIQGCNLNLVDVNQTGTPREDMEEAVGFSITKGSDLEFSVLGGTYRGWNGGHIATQGGFTLKSAKSSLSLQNFMVVQRENGTPHNLYVVAGKDPNAPAVFDMMAIKVMFDRQDRGLVFGYADLVLNAHGAELLGRPDLANQVLGMITFTGSAGFVAGDANDQPTQPTARPTGLDGTPLNGDIQLFELYSCQSFGRVGTYPNGTSGLGMATTSCNVTTITGDNVNWYSPFNGSTMDERHPVIAMNMYRLRSVTGAGTRLEHIGVGWVKHGFLSLNSSQCGSCQDPGGGHLLGVRCSDTYGSSLNASRSYLGPRDEVNAFTGRWECTGSYFANYLNDCVDRFTTSGLSPIDHRLQVRDQDLLTANSQYFYEAYYVSENDADRYNSAGWRRVTPSWSAAQVKFNFTDNTPIANGVLVDTWGQMQPAPRSQPQDEGDILVAVEVTDLGNGTWHYEFAVYNHTSNRQVRTFSVPIPNGANITNIEFHDPDFDANNDWTPVVQNGAVTWSTDTYAENPQANSIEWSSLYNFRFDANVAPENGIVGQVMFRPGTAQSLQTASRVPTSGQVMPTLDIERGVLMTGNVNDLLFSEDSRLQMRPGPVFSTSDAPVRLLLEGTSHTATPASMTFRYEGQASSASIQRRVEAYNFSTGQWVSVNTGASTTSDSSVAVNITNPAQFVQVGTNKVRVRLSFIANGPVFAFPWTARVDRAVWDIQ